MSIILKNIIHFINAIVILGRLARAFFSLVGILIVCYNLAVFCTLLVPQWLKILQKIPSHAYKFAQKGVG